MVYSATNPLKRQGCGDRADHLLIGGDLPTAYADYADVFSEVNAGPPAI